MEDEAQVEALLAAGDLLMIADAPAEESPAHSPVPDSFESVASAPSHTRSAQHFSHGSDPDQASSVAPIPSFAFDHDDVEDSDPIFPPGFDPDQDIEFIPMDQPMEDPVDPVDPVDPIDPEFDFEMAFDDPEPAMAPEKVAALDPAFEHDPVHAGAPFIEPVIADPPADDHPVDAPLLEGDHDIAADHVDPPLIADAPVDPLVAPPPDPVPLEPGHALFAAHLDPRDEHAQHGWIPADDEVPPIPPHTTDARHVDFSFPVPQFTPPARPGEGSSAHPFGHVPMSVPFMPQFPPVLPPVSPFHVAPFDPAREPFLWSSPPVMPPTDPYHPFHMGHSIEDVLMSFVFQHEAHTAHSGARESSAAAVSVPGSDPLSFAALSTFTTGLCCTSLCIRAAGCFFLVYPESHGGGLAPVASFVLHSLSPSSTAICVELISTIWVDAGEKTAIAFNCTAFLETTLRF
ncbi:hypothetical protein HanRHA438_Chr09g0375921 [Helianthus annuus]|nr:hypothetical protein HanRHA438_Chr09g0375921 [Helianthus annuus]